MSCDIHGQSTPSACALVPPSRASSPRHDHKRSRNGWCRCQGLRSRSQGNDRGDPSLSTRVRHVVKNGGPVHSGTVPVLPRGRPTRAWVDVSRHLQLTNDDLVSGTAYPIAETRESDTWNGAVQGHEHVRLGGSQTGSRTNGDGRFPAPNAPANGRILLSVSWQPRFMPRCGTEAG